MGTFLVRASERNQSSWLMSSTARTPSTVIDAGERGVILCSRNFLTLLDCTVRARSGRAQIRMGLRVDGLSRKSAQMGSSSTMAPFSVPTPMTPSTTTASTSSRMARCSTPSPMTLSTTTMSSSPTMAPCSTYTKDAIDTQRRLERGPS